jgi:hypothetical protein
MLPLIVVLVNTPTVSAVPAIASVHTIRVATTTVACIAAAATQVIQHDAGP